MIYVSLIIQAEIEIPVGNLSTGNEDVKEKCP
jgi:hypothetical protein